MRKFAALLVALAFAGTTMVAFAAEEAKPAADKPAAAAPAAEKKHAKKAKKEAPAKEAPAAAPAAPEKK